MSVLAVLGSVIAGLLAFVVNLLAQKSALRSENNQLKSDKIGEKYEEKSKESGKAAVDSVARYKQLLRKYEDSKSDK